MGSSMNFGDFSDNCHYWKTNINFYTLLSFFFFEFLETLQYYCLFLDNSLTSKKLDHVQSIFSEFRKRFNLIQVKNLFEIHGFSTLKNRYRPFSK